MNPSLSRPQMIAAIVGCLLTMAAVDHYTGQELVFSCAYLIPVCLTAWWFQRRWVFAMAAVSGVAAYVVDVIDGYEFSHPGIGYWNALTCFIISSVTGIVLSRLKDSFEAQARMNQQLREALDQLEKSTREIRKLQNGLQTICAWTKKIQVGDSWMNSDEFFSKVLGLEVSHGMSPEALEGFLSGVLKQPPHAA